MAKKPAKFIPFLIFKIPVNSYPYDEDEEEVEDPKGPMDLIAAFGSFIWFQRRTIVGAILLVGLAVMIYKVYMIPPKTFENEERVTSLLVDPPSSSIDFNAFEGMPTADPESGEPVTPKIFTMEDIVLPESEKIVAFDPVLKSGTVDELIEVALGLRDAWVGKSPQDAFMMCQRRAQIDRRLMELELTNEEQNFALGDYIETIICLDKIVSEHQYKAPQIRSALKEIAEKYTNHSDPIVCAKANLAAVSAPMHDFYHDNQTEQLEVFSRLVPNHIDKIFGDPAATGRLAGLTLKLHRSRNWDGSALPYCLDIVKRMEACEDQEIKNSGIGLRERLYFEHLEPNKIVERIKLDDLESRANVKQFFEALEANPNSRLQFFQVAVSTIETFKRLDKKEDYQNLLLWLQRISTKIGSKAKRDEIASVILKLDEIPFGQELPDATVPQAGGN